MNINDTTLPFATWNKALKQLNLSYAPEYGALFYSMCPTPLPSFTPGLMGDLDRFQHLAADFLNSQAGNGTTSAIRYLIHASDVPGIFNLGGDLGFFVDCIRRQDRQTLADYAALSIDVLHRNLINLDTSAVTIAMLEGTTIGAGFEAALSSDIIIAERGIELGFPEVVFNMFPGMGAYSFLARRIPPVMVERMIMSGRMYRAEDLYEQGVIDILAEPGQARSTLASYLRKRERTSVTHAALIKMRNRVHPITHTELMDIANIWVEAAISLPERSLKTMERLVRAQTHRTASNHIDTQREA